MQPILITGTDTDVGKTVVTTMLLRTAIAAGVSVAGYKPACSGAIEGSDGQFAWSDVDRIFTALDGRFPKDQICPQRFRAPLAPPQAARAEERLVDSQLLRTGIDAFRSQCELMIVEGAGGILCPLSDDTTVLDLAVDLQCDVVVVAANKLGVVNHTLLTVSCIEQRQLSVAAIVLNDTTAQEQRHADESTSTNASLLQHWLPHVPLVQCPFNSEHLVPLSDHDSPGYIARALR